MLAGSSLQLLKMPSLDKHPEFRLGRNWEKLEQLDINERQLKVVRKMLNVEAGDFEGGMRVMN